MIENNFVAQRRSFGTIALQDEKKYEEFQVECSGGKVFDRASQI